MLSCMDVYFLIHFTKQLRVSQQAEIIIGYVIRYAPRKCNVAQSISLNRGGGSFTVSWRNPYVERTRKNFPTKEIEWERRARRRQTRWSIRLPVGIVVFRQSILAEEESSRDATRLAGSMRFPRRREFPCLNRIRLILTYNVKRRLGDANLVVVKFPLSPSLIYRIPRRNTLSFLLAASIVQARRRETTAGKSKRDVNSTSRKKNTRRRKNSTLDNLKRISEFGGRV